MRVWWSAISLRGLRVQILLWTILPLTILLIGFSLTGVRSHQESMRAMVAERDTGLARILAGAIAALLDRYTGSLQIAASGAAHGDDLQALDARLADLSQALEGMTLWIVDSDGQVVAGAAEAPAWVGTAVSQSRRDPGAANAPAILALAAEQTVLWIVPIDEDAGWLVGALPLPVLQLPALFAASGVGATGAALLVNQDCETLYAVGDLDAPYTAPGIDEALAGQSGVAFAPHPQGEQVVAYAPVPGAGWALVLRESWEALADPLLRFDRIMPFVLLTAAVVSLLALVFGLRYVVRPLQKLDAQANQIGQGDFDAASDPVGGVKEIEELRRTLDRMARELRRYQDTLQDYLGAITKAQEEERARLSRELHDGTVQTLIALGQRLQMIQRILERDPQRAGARLAELRVMAGEAVDEVRRFSRALRPVYLEELGLAPALEMLAHENGAQFQGRGQARRLSPEQEGALFRIAQEALSNATRHAQAAHIQIRLEFDEQRVSLHVQDDGVGFALPDHFHDLTRNGHFGLVGMVERAQIVGGRLTIASKPGEGTTVSVTLSA